MGTSRFTRYVERVRGVLRLAVSEDHPPHHIAVSFALGVFLTALPNVGGSILVLAWIGHRFRWANKFAFATAIGIMNPPVKVGVYLASFFIGVQLFGPLPGITSADVGIDAGGKVLVRLLVGNVILAIGFAVVGYVVAYLTAREVRRHG
ncbi:MAG: DUF2062 domain-containing protein [Halovenus sp.]